MSAAMSSFLARRMRPPRQRLDWVLIYGPVRTGTTLMKQLVAETARREVSDWGLGPVAIGPVGANSRLDLTKFRRLLARQVLADATRGGGTTLDLVYKQANLTVEEHAAVTDIWGPPRRTIFCFREPAAFLASAQAKFPDVEVQQLRERNYLATVETFERIGGDVFVYGPGAGLEDYLRFLAPLPVVGRTPVEYRGSRAPELATPAMWDVFERIREQARFGDLSPVEQGA